MLSEPKLKVLQDLIAASSKEELLWINGYFNGIIANHQPATNGSAVAGAVVANKITIVYGTETGNSKALASQFAAKAKKNGINAKVFGADQYRLTDLVKEEYFLVLMSTHGDGEAPDAAKKFYDHIVAGGLNLSKLKYSVLGLGDTSYPLFCNVGENIDAELEKMGGKRLVPIQKCDVDYEADANQWFDKVLQSLSQKPAAATTAPVAANGHATFPPAKKTAKLAYTGTVLTNVDLNDKGSNKQTYHIEIAAEGVEYQCGDSIGIVPENDSQLVTDIIAKTNIDGNKIVEFKKEKYTQYELLKKKINLIHLTERLVKQYADATGHDIPVGRYDLLELVQKYPVKSPSQFEEILVGLNAISPRLYTLASSPKAHEGEVHIIVAKDVYTDAKGNKRNGLCSNFLGELKVNAKQNFFVQTNKRFRLPADDKDIIMVGPGTGIAAFRSFLAERDATGATGRNWLFFGEQNFATDFLYQTEIQNWYETGVLTKINVAFSRDQKEKVYVQHKMLEHGESLYEWITGGASFYICGKKDPMSTDVENALLHVIEQHGKKTIEEAKAYLEKMKEEGRYEKDVY
ncbi:flavodoxin domain-containing protein [Ferruginibacter lapsinanis]|uniref:diflavin oxidoreductase n=1 Tax=Ferruginibacter lapsinanis TaxID=563172 RepID=UPI001E5CA3A8|nr:flavodoxin domain-containing protein [Ferruginibacter lapsinanis]UEG48994.1 flavodoxin domain-containing protein [Ferruginibacter lapsinanis]